MHIGAAALADVLEFCTNLETLNIMENDIGSEGAVALADGLKSCTNLQTLSIKPYKEAISIDYNQFTGLWVQ